MSRTAEHGGGSWGFPNCLWSPTHKKTKNKKTREGQTSGYWENMRKIEPGSVIFHLRGAPQDRAWFVGYSVAADVAEITSERPPKPGSWAYAKRFYRVNLHGYTPFTPGIKLTDVFTGCRRELEEYYAANRQAPEKRLLFYTHQKGTLQCQFGAYLSEVDDRLFEILFEGLLERHLLPEHVIRTGETVRPGISRIGQQAFADRIKAAYGHQCCFPDCGIRDSRFLIGAHIARWRDNPELRGHMGNGLCLCEFHDRAFEHGLFTFDQNFHVHINDDDRQENSAIKLLEPFRGRKIRSTGHLPLSAALKLHWERHGLHP